MMSPSVVPAVEVFVREAAASNAERANAKQAEALTEREQGLDNRERVIAQAAGDAEAMRAAYEAKLAKLKGAMD